MKMVSLGPWPLGQDTVSAPTSEVFQLPIEGQQQLPRLTSAVNVDLDRFGWPRRRPGTASCLTGTSFLSAFSGAGLFLLQDGGTINKVTVGAPYTVTALVTGLSAAAAVQYLEWDTNTVFWTNGITGGLITRAGAAQNWGLGVPGALTLGSTAGVLAAGKYRVAATYEDGQKREGGAQDATEVTLAAGKSITVNLTIAETNATYVNLYVSPGPDQEELYWNKRVAVGALPATITNVRVSRRPLRTQHLRGPVFGAGIGKYKGYVLTWRDNVVFRSQALVPHLFSTRNFWQFEHAVVGVSGLESGLYVATLGGLYWVENTGMHEWSRRQIDKKMYTSGSLVISGGLVGKAETAEKIAIFASQEGLVLGLPNGQVVYPTEGRMAINPTGAKVQFLHRMDGDVRQLLMLVG